MRVAVVPGDGIGGEVVHAALPALETLDRRFGLGLKYRVFGWGADEWLATGTGLPDGALEMLRAEYPAILLGALGDPRIPDMAHGRAILLGLRRGLDLYVNYRPIPLPGGTTVELFRENTQGLYSGVGGTVSRGTMAQVAIDESVYTRDTVERFTRYSLGRVRALGCRKAVLVHKANAVPNTGRLWQEVFRHEARAFPELEVSDEYVDSFCYHLIRDPARYQGVLAPNLFGDIISDIGAALMGGLGLATSASLCPETGHALFEPVHGSAPDIAGKGIANPYAALRCLVLMLDHFGHEQPARLLGSCLDEAIRTEAATPDAGGSGTTSSFMTEVMARLES